MKRKDIITQFFHRRYQAWIEVDGMSGFVAFKNASYRHSVDGGQSWQEGKHQFEQEYTAMNLTVSEIEEYAREQRDVLENPTSLNACLASARQCLVRAEAAKYEKTGGPNRHKIALEMEHVVGPRMKPLTGEELAASLSRAGEAIRKRKMGLRS